MKAHVAHRVQGLIIVVAVLVAYANTLHVPLLLDDLVTIANNPTLGAQSAFATVLRPPAYVYSSGRPILNASFALNYAWSGMRVESYHAVNLVIHLASALVLWRLLAATFTRPPMPARLRADAAWIATVVAVLWAAHPVQTEAVTYISQRAESLMGLWYLLALGCARRANDAGNRLAWQGAAVVACALGMATKEVMVTAPVAILLYDRIWLAESFADVFRRRRWFYLLLFGTWGLLGYLMASSSMSARDVGSTELVSPLAYALVECRVVLAYLKQCLWPARLVFYYGPELFTWYASRAVNLLCFSVLAAALVAAVVGVIRRRPAALGALLFFLLLAPTSSILPLSQQPMAESRLYLPLAPLVAAGVVCVLAAVGRRGFVCLAVVAIGFVALSLRRNADYRSEVALWSDTVRKLPQSARAHCFLGVALAEIPGRRADAIAEYETSCRLNPRYAEAYQNIAVLIASEPGRQPEAVAYYETALALAPGHATIHANFANLLAHLPGRMEEALSHFAEAARLRPDSPELQNDLGNALALMPGRSDAAEQSYARALALRPEFAAAHLNLANLLSRFPERRAEARRHYEAALRIDPNSPDAHNGLGLLLASAGEIEPAALHYAAALRARPDFAEAQHNWGTLLGGVPGREDESIAHFMAALRIRPDYPEARQNLEVMKRRRAAR